MTYPNLESFLREGNEEGTRLDYKREWVSDIPRVACAFANTSGGHIVVGVEELRGPEAYSSRSRILARSLVSPAKTGPLPLPTVLEAAPDRL